jgi:hypothetical protein
LICPEIFFDRHRQRTRARIIRDVKSTRFAP